ncbi:MAG: hypothetical protein J0L75_12875 [Spirochaetes bacterium]|nr:hypothetical protein [Spirochaetota bacterium]
METIADVLERVFAQPTAPYREAWVADWVTRELTRLGVPHCTDRYGNLFAGCASPLALARSKKIILVAHMDHPGFQLVRDLGRGVWRARWFGGFPPKMTGARVAIHHPSYPRRVWKGAILKTMMDRRRPFFKIRITGDGEGLDRSCFGGFDFPHFQRRGTRVYTRAADDLGGVAMILASIARLPRRLRGATAAIFSRAEEVGFRGVLGLLRDGRIGPNNAVISIETSRALPGAVHGRGPIIRLGDRSRVFDSGVIARLDAAAARLKKTSPSFRYQRRLMDGGTCEATPFVLAGIPAAGLALPLGNYHNERPDGRPGAEYIDVRDLEGAVALCVQLAKDLAAGRDPSRDLRDRLRKGFLRDRPRLLEKTAFRSRS